MYEYILYNISLYIYICMYMEGEREKPNSKYQVSSEVCFEVYDTIATVGIGDDHIGSC